MKAVTMKDSEKELIQFKAEISKLSEKRNVIQFKINKYKNMINHQNKCIQDIEKLLHCSKKNILAKKKEMKDCIKMNKKSPKSNQNNRKILDEIDKKLSSIFDEPFLVIDENSEIYKSIDEFKLQLQKQKLKNQQCGIRTNAMKKKLKEHLTRIEEAQNVYDKQVVLLTSKENEYQIVKDKYSDAIKMLFYYKTLRLMQHNLLRIIQDLNASIESFELNNSDLFFQYTDPRPNFDRRKVHGLVCRLFKPIDFKFELALTTLAGSQLYFIVVDDDTVCKDILETNNFPNRMNFVPLNVIESNCLSPNVISIAQQIGGADQVFPAMSLITYDEKHLKAVQWVFGQAFVCTTKEIAEKVCFDSRVNKHCITLEGDHFYPSGNITGEANVQRLVLKEIAHQDEIKSQLQRKQSELAQIDNLLATMVTLPYEVSLLWDGKFILERDIKIIKQSVCLGPPDKQETETNNIEKEIAELENKLAKGKTDEEHFKSSILELETKVKDSDQAKNQELKQTDQLIKKYIENIKYVKCEYAKILDCYGLLQFELYGLLSQEEQGKKLLAKANKDKSRYEKELIVIMANFHDVDNMFNKAYKDYNSQKEKLMKNEEIEHA